MKKFSAKDMAELKDFITNFFARYRKDIMKENYVQFYIFACPYDGYSGMWSIQLGTSPENTLYCGQDCSLITRVDVQSILDNFKEAEATITMPDDYLWMVKRFI